MVLNRQVSKSWIIFVAICMVGTIGLIMASKWQPEPYVHPIQIAPIQIAPSYATQLELDEAYQFIRNVRRTARKNIERENSVEFYTSTMAQASKLEDLLFRAYGR